MKELERTERISVSAVLFLLVILIGVLTFKRPEYVFHKDATDALSELKKGDYVLSQEELKAMDPSKYVLIDIREKYEYDKGHIKDALNISAHQVFNKETKDLLNKINEEGKTIVLYGSDPDNASGGWLLLYQLGYDNVKILRVSTYYADNKFHIDNYELEKPNYNYAEVMKESASADTQETAKPTKKVFVVKKKKKRVAEGGC